MRPRLRSRGVSVSTMRILLVAQASMRPRLRSRGVPRRISRTFNRPNCFNEAAASQPRSRCRRPLARSRSSCFNEAAASQPRSRGGSRVVSPELRRASMRPRLRSRGVPSRIFGSRSISCRFNEAAASQPRSLAQHADEGVDDLASMRPRLRSRGVWPNETATVWPPVQLQ